MIYNARCVLKGLQSPVFINEDLTPTAASLFHLARKGVKEKGLASAWTMSGRVYVKYSLDPDAKPCRIKTADDLLL